jgi:hypothetical protein
VDVHHEQRNRIAVYLAGEAGCAHGFELGAERNVFPNQAWYAAFPASGRAPGEAAAPPIHKREREHAVEFLERVCDTHSSVAARAPVSNGTERPPVAPAPLESHYGCKSRR